MISALDVIVLTESLAELALEKGDVGTIVHIYNDGEAYEVEFATLNGIAAALVTLKPAQFRAVDLQRDMSHVRDWPNGDGSSKAIAA